MVLTAVIIRLHKVQEKSSSAWDKRNLINWKRNPEGFIRLDINWNDLSRLNSVRIELGRIKILMKIFLKDISFFWSN